MPLQTREATLRPSTFNEADNTVECVWTTGARRTAYDWTTGGMFEEELAVEASAVDMSRFDGGVVHVLDSHQRFGLSTVLGIAVRGLIAKGEGHATLRLSGRPEVAGIVGDIKAGIIRAMSFGYSVQKYEITRAQDRTDGGTLPLYRATRWTPQELTFCSVPADPKAQTRSATTDSPCEFVETNLPKDRTMPQAQETQTRDAAEIREEVRRHGLPDALATTMVDRNLDLTAARGEILAELARRDFAAGGHQNVRSADHFHLQAETQLQSDLMIAALAGRMGCPMPKGENAFRHARLVDMARDCLEVRGTRTSHLSPSQIIDRAHTTSDFPQLLQGAGNRVLRQSYDSYAGGLKRICRPSTVRDFRAKQLLMLGEAPTLLKVNEHGEFKHGSMAEGKESYALATYGRIFGITRQSMVNDDLQAFGSMAVKLGRAAAEFEAKFLVDLLTSNPTMTDTVALFHASHGNLATGGASALQSSSLVTARTAMRLQKGLDATTPVDVTPRYLVVPAALEQTGLQLIATITPGSISDVNPFSGKLELVVDPRLDAVSATAWYLAADPGTIDTLEYAYLDGEEGPQVFTSEGWEIDGIEFKVREDFGAGAIDWRGLYKANGA
jgi:phage head maturation protease